MSEDARTCPKHGPFDPANFCCACVHDERNRLASEPYALTGEVQRPFTREAFDAASSDERWALLTVIDRERRAHRREMHRLREELDSLSSLYVACREAEARPLPRA